MTAAALRGGFTVAAILEIWRASLVDSPDEHLTAAALSILAVAAWKRAAA